MAEWTNIFDLGEWDVYVRYYGVTSDPTPDSRGHLVRAAELDPEVGSVQVTPEGLIACTFENAGTSSFPMPTVLVMPVGLIAAAPIRLTCSEVSGLEGGVSSSAFAECTDLVEEGGGAYSVSESDTNRYEYATPEEWQLATVLPSDLPQGSGAAFIRIGNSA